REVLGLGEHRDDAPAHELVIVDEHDPDRHPRILCGDQTIAVQARYRRSATKTTRRAPTRRSGNGPAMASGLWVNKRSKAAMSDADSASGATQPRGSSSLRAAASPSASP